MLLDVYAGVLRVLLSAPQMVLSHGSDLSVTRKRLASPDRCKLSFLLINSHILLQPYRVILKRVMASKVVDDKTHFPIRNCVMWGSVCRELLKCTQFKYAEA